MLVGCRPTEETLNNVFLELSRIGSHKVVIAILEQLQRYRIPVSTISLNSMLNSCEKAGDYAAALAIGEQKMSPQQIDQVGMSVLVKSCDKMNMVCYSRPSPLPPPPSSYIPSYMRLPTASVYIHVCRVCIFLLIHVYNMYVFIAVKSSENHPTKHACECVCKYESTRASVCNTSEKPCTTSCY